MDKHVSDPEKACNKEALLLHHLTVANRPPSPLIAKFVDFLHDRTHSYLVIEGGGDLTLDEWVKRAFKYIANNQLSLTHYKNIIKYIFWQIALLFYWLHEDM